MLEVVRREQFDWGVMDWLAEGADKGVSIARMTVKSKSRSPAHCHGNCNEVIHLLSGRIKQRKNAAWREMAPGDTMTIYAGETHQTHNDGDIDAVMLIGYSSGVREFEEVIE